MVYLIHSLKYQILFQYLLQCLYKYHPFLCRQKSKRMKEFLSLTAKTYTDLIYNGNEVKK